MAIEQVDDAIRVVVAPDDERRLAIPLASASQGPDQAAAGEDHRHRDEPEGYRRRHRGRARRDQRIDQEQEPRPPGGELRYVTDLVGDRAIETLLVDVVHAAHSRQQQPGNNGDRDDHQRLLWQHLVPERFGRGQQPERAHHRDRVADRQHASHGVPATVSVANRRLMAPAPGTEEELAPAGRAVAPVGAKALGNRKPAVAATIAVAVAVMGAVPLPRPPGRCGRSRSFSLTVSS